MFGWTDGAFAEYAIAPEDQLAAKPANLSFVQAAVVPISGFAALQGLRDEGQVQPGQQVLIIGAAGGVGSFAMQLAKAFGAQVTGVASTSQAELVRSSVPTVVRPLGRQRSACARTLAPASVAGGTPGRG